MGGFGFVMYLNVADEEVLVKRILNRAASGASDRTDDDEATIRKRLVVNREQCEPCVEHYRRTMPEAVKEVNADVTREDNYDACRALVVAHFRSAAAAAPESPVALIDSHLEFLRSEYGELCRHLCSELRRAFPRDVVDFDEPQGGYFVWARLGPSAPIASAAQLSSALDSGRATILEGEACVPVGDHAAVVEAKRCFRLSFAYQTRESITDGVQELKRALHAAGQARL